MADEDRPRAARAQRLRDADAIQRGAEAGFRETGRWSGWRRASSCRSARPADHAEQRRRAAAGRLRPLAARQPQMHPQQIGRDLELPAFELVEYGEMLARRLLQPEDVDAGIAARQAAQPEMVGKRLGRRSGWPQPRAIMPWNSMSRRWNSRDVEGGIRQRQLRLHAVPQRRRLRAVAAGSPAPAIAAGSSSRRNS